MTVCPKLSVTHQLDGITLIPTRRHNPTVLALEFGGLLYTRVACSKVLPFRHNVSLVYVQIISTPRERPSINLSTFRIAILLISNTITSRLFEEA